VKGELLAREPLRINGYLAFAIGICLTIWTCILVVEAQDAQIRSNFARDTDKVAADTTARLRTYFDSLLSIKALFSVKGEVDREQFTRFVRELRLTERYPGFVAVQFVRYVPDERLDAFTAGVRSAIVGQAGMPPFAVHPRVNEQEHFVIEYNEPMKGNENAFGLDLAGLPPQLAAVRAARDSGRIVATGPTRLVQDQAAHPGFTARAPVYRSGMPLDTVAQRRAAFVGAVAIVFRADELMREVVDPGLLQHLAVRIVDSGEVTPDGVPASTSPTTTTTTITGDPQDQLLFDSHPQGARIIAQRVLRSHIDVAQRRWQLTYSALAVSRYGRDIRAPMLVALGGLVISSLIAALLLSSRRGVELERQLRAILEEKEASLAELEQQKRQVELAHGDLSAVLLTLKQAQANLITSEKLASLGALVAGIAHELNTPIGNSLLTATALADMVAEFEKQYAQGGIRRSALEAHLADTRLACGIMASSLGRAADLITSFKQVSVDQTSDQRRRFALADVVRDTVATYAAQLRRANCRTDVDIAPGLLLDSYPGGLGQVLSNLINNALLHAFNAGTALNQSGVTQFGPQAGTSWRITISAGDIDGKHVVLIFSDDGVGMNEKTLHQIFDPFFTTKLGQGGSGLGMNIVYNVVTGMLGGTISIASTPGQGTSVTIMLPTVAPRGGETIQAASLLI
jgi:signal transduction histidine kinase